MSKQSLRKDFYKILRVSRTATTMEIKSAYRQLALSLHPDRHDGCNDKTKLFKEASEAYTVLVNNESRKEYDMETGFVPNGWYNKNRRRPPPSDYRKVYAPHPPPDGKWNDAQRHYDMHYGDGQYNETIRNSFNRSKRNGEFDYHSPLGKGFTFDHNHNHYYSSSSSSSSHNNYRPFTSTNNNSTGDEEEKLNPYSKSKQGPPVQQYMYEEQKGSLNEANTILKRKNGVKSKLHERRQERYAKQQQQQQQKQQQANVPGQKVYKAFNEQEMVEGGGGGCTIM